jgi:hypothetical protein
VSNPWTTLTTARLDFLDRQRVQALLRVFLAAADDAQARPAATADDRAFGQVGVVSELDRAEDAAVVGDE